MLRPQAGIQVDKFYPPYDWLDTNNKVIDIRKNAEDNTITLLYGVGAENKYGLFGLLAQVSEGTYDVYIDDVLFATTASNTQTDIDFSTLGDEYVAIGTATTPENLTLHKIVIKPNTSGSTITQFRCIRTTGASGTQQQGVLWCHFELENRIGLSAMNYTYNLYSNPNLISITAKNNNIFLSAVNNCFTGGLANLEYMPILDCSKVTSNINYLLLINALKLKRLIINNNVSTRNGFLELVRGNTNCEQITGKYSNYALGQRSYENNYKLKVLPTNNRVSSSTTIISSTNLSNLYPTKIDLSNANDRTQVLLNGTSTYPMRGLRGLKVSNEAPFSGSAPQINVNYTGLDRDNLVELFNSLPAFMPLTKVGSQTISNGVASGFSSSDYLSLGYNNAPDLSGNFEIQVKFTTSSSISNCGLIASNNYWYNGFRIVNNKVDFSVQIGTLQSCSINYDLNINTTYIAKAKRISNKLDCYLYDENNNLLSSNSIILVEGTFSKTAWTYIGYGGQAGAFNGSIDLNPANSYIKIDDTKYQFRLPSGSETTASNPQCSIVACTGTSSLTAEDKDIALNKNWDLVLS